MTKKTANTVLHIASAIVILALALCHVRSRSIPKAPGEPLTAVQTDTLYLRDTVRITAPDAVSVTCTDTVRLPAIVHTVRDTVRLTDTVYVEVPREQKHYSGTDYDAWVSGYMPSLDSLRLYRNTVQVVNTATTVPARKKDRWGIGIHLGYGLTLSPTPEPHPYIGVGISYNILTF